MASIVRSAVWFRLDLRIHDHEALLSAIQAAGKQPIPGNSNARAVLPIYIIDERIVSPGPSRFSRYGLPKTGPRRAKFTLESVEDLRRSLQKIGSNLVVRRGIPEQLLPPLLKQYNVKSLHFHRDVCREEINAEKAVEAACKAEGIACSSYWGGLTLTHLDDLPFTVPNLPNVYTNFRKSVESNCSFRPPLPTPTLGQLAPLPEDLDVGSIPTLRDLGYADLISSLPLAPMASGSSPAPVPSPVENPENALPEDPRGVMKFVGGETAALARVRHYFWDSDCLRSYKETRNGMLGADYSSKFSIWLWNGCVSPRYIYAEVKRYERERIANESTYWLIFELLWRDYFKFSALKWGDRMFYASGIRGERDASWNRRPLPYTYIGHPKPEAASASSSSEPESRRPAKMPRTRGADPAANRLFEAFKEGRTGYPLVDANMRELACTGFMSNRGRQNVASFLTKDLKLDWLAGAELFEMDLIDYDVPSNWLNWQYASGIGQDPRENRHFNVTKQLRDYDANGEYVKTWCPELSHVPAAKIAEPWKMSHSEQTAYSCIIGQDYPHPLVSTAGDYHKHAASAAKQQQGSRSNGGGGKGGKGPLDKYFKQ